MGSEHRESSRHKSSNHSSSKSNNYSGEMVLDPMTGEMVPAEHDPDEYDDEPTVLNEKKNVVIKLGQLTSKSRGSDKSTQGSHSSVPKLKINLGGRPDGSANNGDLKSSSSSSRHSSRHSSHHKSSHRKH